MYLGSSKIASTNSSGSLRGELRKEAAFCFYIEILRGTFLA
jgi:hypothetical protein